ncbi:MAG: hypothetical protein EAZ85_03660 [Bacteroidetes bacterium]|nr:MAG: hypothetical protein EAZ85_03660 [Bacteroidota bacterium]TAG89587.1 MAG: hypothetical protein EAZ20_06175 [Bacteroidota bacterium]
MKNNFIINQNFVVDVTKNTLNNLHTAQETRLEPRIMSLLLLLVENESQLLTREKAIEQIWQNYAGADEGLTQAISFLRKILADKNKSIIKTISKKGYIFEAIITENLPQNAIVLTSQKSFLRKIFTPKNNILIILCLFFVAFLSYYYYQKTKNYGAESPHSYSQELNKGAEEPQNKPKNNK